VSGDPLCRLRVQVPPLFLPAAPPPFISPFSPLYFLPASPFIILSLSPSTLYPHSPLSVSYRCRTSSVTSTWTSTARTSTSTSSTSSTTSSARSSAACSPASSTARRTPSSSCSSLRAGASSSPTQLTPEHQRGVTDPQAEAPGLPQAHIRRGDHKQKEARRAGLTDPQCMFCFTLTTSKKRCHRAGRTSPPHRSRTEKTRRWYNQGNNHDRQTMEQTTRRVCY
jgi:hypothetical protein